jgi:hypothetical protein
VLFSHLLTLNVIRTNNFKNSLLIFVTLFFTISCAQVNDHGDKASAETATLADYIFSPSDNISTEIKQTLTTAQDQNKKALLVLGAQWCHDSKGLAKNFSSPEMQKILVENYQVLFIDVGYFENGFDVVNQFDLPVYYGTPTVMIVDPKSAKVLNKASMQTWLNADSVPLTEYEAYFERFASSEQDAPETNQSMQNYLDEINAFEQTQAIKLKEAYAIIGPLLQQYMQSKEKKASDDFTQKWEQVRKLRYRIQDDIQALTTQARNNVNTGSSAPLNWPEYPVFPWK